MRLHNVNIELHIVAVILLYTFLNAQIYTIHVVFNRCSFNQQICEIKLSPLPFINSHQGSVHLKISYIDSENEECVVYKQEVPDTKKSTNSTITAGATTNQPTLATAATHHHGFSNGKGGSGGGGVQNNTTDGIVITLDKALSGDIKVEFYMKQRIPRRKTLFSFWFNTYFVSERENDGKLNKRIEKFLMQKLI